MGEAGCAAETASQPVRKGLVGTVVVRFRGDIVRRDAPRCAYTIFFSSLEMAAMYKTDDGMRGSFSPPRASCLPERAFTKAFCRDDDAASTFQLRRAAQRSTAPPRSAGRMTTVRVVDALWILRAGIAVKQKSVSDADYSGNMREAPLLYFGLFDVLFK